MDHKDYGYTLLRVVMGINMFMHGAGRLFVDYGGFADAIQGEFSGTILPNFIVLGTAYVIPIVEVLIGVSLILGLFTFAGLVLSGFLMATVVFGMSLLKNWGTVGTQMVYVIIFAALFFGLDYNRLSLDKKIIE